MQNAKDTFYEVLRSRLAAVNPQRTINVRGLVRPGVLVDENEFSATAALTDCFHLRWTAEVCDVNGGLPLVTMTCEVEYATAGSTMNSGLDRGRALAAMDGELLTAVQLSPQNSVKNNYVALPSSGVVTAMNTRIWWREPVFGPCKVEREQLKRTAEIDVMSYQEAGEL